MISTMEHLSVPHELDEALNPKTKEHFDVLNRQTEITGQRGEEAFLRAAKENQPTKLELPEEQISEEIRPELQSQEIIAGETKAEGNDRIFSSNHPLTSYVSDLVHAGRKVKGLKWDLEHPISEEKFKENLERYLSVRGVNKKEMQEMLSLFNASETKVAQDEAFPKSDEVLPATEDKSENVMHGGDNEIIQSSDGRQIEQEDTVEENSEESPNYSGEQEIGESLEDVDKILSETRAEYASQLTDWKNKTREKKGKFAKVLSDLGVERRMPDLEKPRELAEAEAAYMEAKKKKRQSIFSQSETVTGVESGHQFNMEMIKEAESEYEILKRKVTESLPPLEKGIVTKAFEKWANLPMPARVALSTALLTGTSVAIGSLALGGAAAYGGYRLARGLTGAAVSQGVGKWVDGIFKKGNERIKSEILREYGTNISEENFEKKEKEMARAFEEEEDAVKRQRLYKAGAMIAAGGLASGIIGKVSALQQVDVPSGGGSKVPENIPRPEASVPEPTVLPKASDALPDQPVMPMVSENIPEMKVELSSRGFIQDFENLKSKLVEQYGSAENVPHQYDHFVKTPSTKLAQEFGFYDPEKNLSGTGLKGESLELGSDGNLSYTDIKGVKTEIFDAKTGTVNRFAGEMKDYSVPSSVYVVAEPEAPLVLSELPIPEAVLETPIIESTAEEPVLEEIVPTKQMGPIAMYEQDLPPAENLVKEISKPDINGASAPLPETVVPESGTEVPTVSRPIEYKIGSGIIKDMNDNIIAHDRAFGREVIWALDDKFQDGEQFRSIREQFNKVLKEIPTERFERLGKNVFPVPFEGGNIHVIQGSVDDMNPNSIKVLLNGKEIAKGVLTTDGPKVEVLKGLKGGFLLADSVYERAFNTKALKIIKTLKAN